MNGASEYRSMTWRLDEAGSHQDVQIQSRSYSGTQNAKTGASVLGRHRREAFKAHDSAPPMRPSTAKADHRADAEAKADEYARWLFARDGGDMTLVSERMWRVYHEQVETHATRIKLRGRSEGETVRYDPKWPPMPAAAVPLALVAWLDGAAGRRPAAVSFRWGVPPSRYSVDRTITWFGEAFLTVELPGWSFDAAAPAVALPDEPEVLASVDDMEAAGLFG